MTPPDQPVEDPLSVLAAACDEALANGDPDLVPASVCADPELFTQLARGVECMRLLRQVFPGKRSDGEDRDECTSPDLEAPPEEAAFAPTNLPGSEGASPTPFPCPPGYEIQGELGRGGMGVVFLAHDARLRRVVALKRIDGERALPRFKAEAEAVARLQHPNIVQIFAVEEHAGAAYLVLEYLPRGSLAEELRDGPQPALVAAALVETLARAIQHAHEHQIVHRDLKPANVLFAADGQPKVVDFGLAKRLGAADGHTRPGDILGTPNYMAPEQAGGDIDSVGSAADVYSLGVILYEMLTGRTPFQAPSALEALLMIRTLEPVSPRRLQPQVPRDLETVCLKCLQKEPGRRYASALALAEDLRRFQSGEPIQARPVSTWERGWRWCGRNPRVAGLAAISAVSLLVLAVGGPLTAMQLARQEATVRETAFQLTLKERDAREKLWRAQFEEARAVRWARRPGHRSQALENLREAASTLRTLHRPDEPERLLDLRNEAIAAVFPRWDLRLHRQWTVSHGDDSRTGFVPDPTLTRMASTDNRGGITVWAVRDGREIARLPNVGKGTHAYGLQFSPDGKFLAARHHREWKWRIWDVDRQQVIAEWPFEAGLDFSPDGRRVALADADGIVHFHDLASWQKSGRIVTGQKAPRIACDPTGHYLAAYGSPQPAFRVFDLSTGRLVRDWTTPIDGRNGPAWSGDGARLTLATGREPVQVWETATGRLVSTCQEKHGYVSLAVLNGDGTLLCTTGWDGKLRVWDVATGNLLLTKFEGTVQWLGTDRQHRLWSTDRQGGDVRIWEVVSGREAIVLRSRTLPLVKPKGIEVSPDGRLLASAHEDGLRLWDLGAGEEMAYLPGWHMHSVAFHPRQSALFASGQCGAYRWSLATDAAGRMRIGPPQSLGIQPTRLEEAGGRYISLAADGQTLALLERVSLRVLLCDLATGRWTTLLSGVPSMDAGALSPDGRWFVGAPWSFDPLPIGVWNRHTGSKVRALQDAYQALPSFSPDSRWLVTATAEEYRFWEVATWSEGRPPLPRERGPGGVCGVSFSGDGRLLALGIASSAVQLQEFATGRELARLPVPPGEVVLHTQLTPDGTRLVIGTDTGTLYLWDLRQVRLALTAAGLDWDAPSYPPPSTPSAPKLVAVEVDRSSFSWLGGLHASRAPNAAPAHARLALHSLQIALCPWHPEPFHARAHAYLDSGQPGQAIADLTAALRLSPAQRQYQAHLHDTRHNCWIALDQIPQAIADLQQAVTLDPTNLEVCTSLARLLVAGPPEHRDPKKALPLAERAARSTTIPANWNTLGVVYYRLRRYQEALAAFDTAGKGWGTQAADLYFLAMCYHHLGEASKACDCFDRAVNAHEALQPNLEKIQRTELESFRAESASVLARAAQP